MLIVGLAVSGHLPALAASGPPLRTGLWVTQPIVGEKAENLEAQVRANPHLSGVCLHIGWKDIEKQPGQFDFSAIDKTVAVLRRIGMKYELGIKPGVETPAKFKPPLHVEIRNSMVHVAEPPRLRKRRSKVSSHYEHCWSRVL